ncbi:hypothetical protein QUW14_16030 [Bacteroides gallinaceum]|uniref:hypothetical protein n=1 Tax=Bacteroides gallinaceum TaxID=1462571 RepID=UPI0025A4A2DB|nr:hypothetical protein [Bacteroides gallinaceum]MDM8155782.1 hypothetical protein [Bacteroides gallinaceum]
MAEQKTLTTIFESNKSVLKERLEGLSLPSDASKIQKIINDYLNEMFNNEGEFRQNLTQSEDYILQAALSLLNAQQSMIKEMAPIVAPQQPKLEPVSQPAFSGLKKEKYPYALGGTAIGGSVGGLLLGTWGAVFGAIAGTAIVLYYASNQTTSAPQRKGLGEKPLLQQPKLNVDAFLAIVKNICGSVDSLIDTFRAQINRVVNKYESQEKPTLEKEYRFLLESVQSLIGYKRAHHEDEKFIRKIQERIEDMAESLDNYNLEVEDYTEEHRNWFDMIENPNVSAGTQVLPAIVKNGNVVLKGRLFVPAINS